MLGRLATDATALRVRSCGLPGASATLRMPYGQRAPPCGETAVPCAASAASQACEEQAALERCVRERYDYDRVVAQAPQPEAVEWIFGYGSIVFKQGFEAAHGLAGCINGWRRGFYQLSTDHRGTPQAPGRTVTLVPDADARTWGMAYKLPENLEERRRALQELEWREKQYDRKVITDIHGDDGVVLVHKALTYVGSDDAASNEFWGGAPPLPDLAAQIAGASGLSGPNHEYLYRLADGLRAMHVRDAHVFELERLVRALRGDAAAPAADGCYRE